MARMLSEWGLQWRLCNVAVKRPTEAGLGAGGATASLLLPRLRPVRSYLPKRAGRAFCGSIASWLESIQL